VDGWINNAGFGLVDSLEKMDMAACRRLFDTNLFAVIEAMQRVIPVMRRQGSGTIVNISSVAGYVAVPYMAAYGASKHALNCITKATRLELKGTGVHVVNVCPGYVKTNFSENVVRGTDRRRIGGGNVRGITAERVAAAILSAYLHHKREIVVPARDRMMIWAYRRMPRLVESVMVRLSKQLK
jgi:short-subunit dehydrogenase